MNQEQANLYEASNPDRTGLWIHTFTGKQFYAFDPHPDDVDIRDIAHALSLTCRYSGHCQDFYSVAQHSVILSNLVDEELALAALLHDAPEAYLTDIPRPIKHMFNEYKLPFSEIEDKIYKVIAEKYGCQYPLPEEVHDLDHNIVADEASVLFAPAPEWTKWYTPVGVDIWPIGPRKAEKQFMYRFKELTGGKV